MRKIFTLFSLILIGKIATAQQDAALAPPSGSFTSPVSGCALTATENVTIRIFNFGPGTIVTPFNVSYSINGGAPVTELVAAPNIPQNTSFTYTFTTQANLSTPGTYTFDATVSVPGDPTAGNNTYTGYVVNALSPSIGGTITAPSSVCMSGNSGILTLGGQTGSVLGWEYSTDGGGTWIGISNTSTSQTYNNLTVPTRYRAQVQNSTCTPVYSAEAIIAIDPVTVAGSVSGTATVCSGTNTGNVTSTGRTGSILKWQFSTDGGVTWTDIISTANSQTYTNLVTSTRYRVQVQSGACASAFSTSANITVNPPSVGGSVAGGTTVCSGANSGTLTLSGHTGSVTRWEFSTNAGATWTNIANTTVTQAYTNLAATRYYRAFVTSAGCTGTYSTIDSIVVTQPSVGGTITANATVCSGANSGTLTLSAFTGTIQYWEFSTDGGATYTNIANTTATQNYLNLTTTTIYRANVKNGVCAAANSSIATITVNPVSVGGTTASNDTVCSGTNGGTITLSGQTGSVTNWESSTDGLTWNPIANTSLSQSYSNLNQTTYYRAIVTSGVCAPATSSIDTITVDQPTVGGTVNSSSNICYGNNTGTLTLSGQTGNVLRWESSIDGGINWVAIANNTTTHVYANLVLTTQYRAVVQNGTCSVVNSTAAILTIDPVTVGGSVTGSTTACGGSNNGTLNLIDYVGSILNWESSTDGGATWTTIANTTATENYTNVLSTTLYRVIVKSGSCSQDTSSVATISVDPPTVGGVLTMDDTVCASANGDTLMLSGHTGNIEHWESSTDGGNTWITLANTTTSQIYANLITTTSYRVLVKSGVCNPMTSNTITITVDPIAVGGTLNGTTTVCDTINSGTLTLTGSSGAIQNWESSVDGGATWSMIANTTTSLVYTNLQDTTWYRVIIMSGTCGGDTSSTAVINVNPATVAGTLSMDDTVCSAVNSGVLHLTGYTGMVIGWEVSTDGGFNWTAVTNTTDSLTYNNLSVNTMYHAIVKSGICNAMTSNSVTITVNPVSASGTISGSTPGCEGANGGTLMVNGYVGSILNWESSIDGGLTWTPTANTSASQMYSNLTDTTWYRVIVQSGVCSADTSAATTVIVYPKPMAMASADTVCFGNTTTFTNTSTISSGFIQFNQWDFGDGYNSLSLNPTHAYAVAGTYNASLLATSNMGCLDTAMVTVIVNAVPSNVITASGPLTFCAGDSVMLSAATGTYTYMWSTSDTTQSITVMTSGTYVVIVTDSITGCSSNNMEIITVLPTPVVFAGNDTAISLGTEITLNGMGVGVVTWTWSPATGLNSTSVPNPLAGPTETTTYQLIGTDANGCTDRDSVMITVIADFNVTISNIMTPNEDGYNDRFIIQNLENYPNTRVTVVNRSGMVVFKSDNYDNNWNGKVQQGTDSYGNTVADGTYYYFIEFEGSDKVYKGAITVLRQAK